MKRQKTDIYADIKEDSVQQQEVWSDKSEQKIPEEENQDEEGEGTEDQQNRGETHSQASQPNQKKESKLKKTEYRINQNQIKDKFSNLLNSQHLVDEDNSTPREKPQLKANNSSGYDTSRSSITKKQIGEVLGQKSISKSSFLQQFQDNEEHKKRISGGMHTLYGVLQPMNKESMEQQRISINKAQGLSSSRLTQLGNISTQRLSSETDIMKNKKSALDPKQNDAMFNTKQAIQGIFLQSQFTSHQKAQSTSSQSKRLSTQQSKSQFDFLRGSTSIGIKPMSRGILPINTSAFPSFTPAEGTKRIKTQGDFPFDNEGIGQSVFFSTSRNNTSQNNSSSLNNVKFKRLQNSGKSQKSSVDIKNSTLTDFRNVSHLHQKSKDQPTPIAVNTPLITQFEQETNEKMKNSQSLNNIYLKMLDEFQIPYEQDLEKIKAKISELKLKSTETHDNIDKSFIIKLLQNQVGSQKIDVQKQRQLRIPTNRYDVEVLKQWLDFMIFKIYQDESNTGQEILEKAQLVFESCFQELLKQISTDCNDRGDLLQKVWKNQNELFTKLVEEQQRQRLIYEQESLDEITRVHKMYTKEVERLRLNLSTTIEEKNKLSERFDLLKNNVKYLKKNNKYVNKMTKTLKEDLDFYKKKNQDLEYAANQLKREYMNLSNSQQQLPTTRTKLKSQAQMGSNSNFKQTSQTDLKSTDKSNKKKKIVSYNNQTLSYIKQQLNEDSPSEEFDSDDYSQDDEIVKDNKRNSSSSKKSKRQSNTSSNYKQVSSEDNFKTINTILEQQSQLTQLQAKFTQNQMNMNEMSEVDDDEDLDKSVYVLDKSIDALEWQKDNCQEQEIQTDAGMNDLIFKNEIITQEIMTQVDINVISFSLIQKVFKEFGDFLADKEVQTTDLDPEYEERMKGQDIQGLEKFLDNISKAQDLYEKAMDSVNVPFEVKKAMHNYLKFLHKNQEQMQFLLKTEIGMKEKYHNENIMLKIFKKESQNSLEELQNRIEQLQEANKQITQENDELDRNIVQLVRRTKKLTTNMEQFKKISSQLYTESNKLADNISKSNVFDKIIKKVADGADINAQDIETLRNKFKGNNSGETDSPTGFLGALLQSQRVRVENDEDFDNEDNENERESKPPKTMSNIRDIPMQSSSVISKIKNAVKQLFDLNDKSFKFDDNSSSGSDDDDVNEYMTQSKLIRNPSKFRLSENHSQSQLSQPNLGNNQMSTSAIKQSANLEKSKGMMPYKFNNPKFERKKVVKINSVNVGASLILFNKVIKRMQKQQPKMTMSRKNLQKQKNDLNRNDPLHVVCYDFFLSNFGLKKVAETKILQLYEAIYFFKIKSIRVKLFGQFLNLFEEYSIDELDFYVSTLKSLDEDVPAYVQTSTQTGEVVYCSFEKIMGILKKQEEGTNKIFMDKQIAYIQKNRVLSKQNNNYPMIDVDIAMEKVLEGYKRIKQNNKELVTLFASADLDLDGVIGFYEFMCLYKYIENKEDEKTELQHAKKLFFTKCDTLNSETGEKSLSMDAFISTCTINGFFRQDKVQKFMNSNLPPNECQNFEQLKANHNEILQQIKMRLIKSSAYTPFFSKGIQNLVKSIKSSQLDAESKQSIWISYRILDLESKKAILLFEMHSFIPSEFIDLMIKYNEVGPEADDEYWPIEYSSNTYIS